MAVALVAVAALVAFLAARYLLPRLAHRAFTAGNFARSRRRYRAVLWTSMTARRRAAARVSIAGAYLAEGRWDDGAAATDAIDGETLDPATRAGWLNNRAYATLRRAPSPEAAERALAQVREALRARPDVPALLHTEGLALLATGRVEESIRVLESLWEHGELGPRLESERSADLARAWAARGETAYAADYARRARQAAPDAPWHAGADAVAPAPIDPALDPALDDPAA